MPYSKYSNYSPEDIINEKYKKLCNQLLSMDNDEKVKEKMERNTIRRWI